MPDKLYAPKGVPEYLPRDSAVFRAVHEALAAPAVAAGYGYVELPVFEDTSLFVRGVGESTDVVSKEMYTFTDRGGRSLTLRPEGTAGVMRSVIEHGLDRGQLPVKLWYAGPFFRAERPQHGRYRQLQQFGVEAIGVRRPGARRRGDHDRGRRLPIPRSDRVPAGAHQPRLRSVSPALPRAADGVPRRARPRRRDPAARGPQPVARARRQATRGAGPARRRTADDRPPVRRLRRPLRRGPRPARRDRRHSTWSTRGWCAGSTTTRAPRSSSCTTASAPSPAWVAAVATTA